MAVLRHVSQTVTVSQGTGAFCNEISSTFVTNADNVIRSIFAVKLESGIVYFRFDLGV